MLSTSQRFAHDSPTAAKLLRVDRLCRTITQAVKASLSAFIMALIRFDLR
jgi:hypothetical protein